MVKRNCGILKRAVSACETHHSLSFQEDLWVIIIGALLDLVLVSRMSGARQPHTAGVGNSVRHEHEGGRVVEIGNAQNNTKRFQPSVKGLLCEPFASLPSKARHVLASFIRCPSIEKIQIVIISMD